MRVCGENEKMVRDRKKIQIANPTCWDKEDFIKYYIVILEVYKL